MRENFFFQSYKINMILFFLSIIKKSVHYTMYSNNSINIYTLLFDTTDKLKGA